MLRLLRDLASHTIAKHEHSGVAPHHYVVPVTDTWARATKIDAPVLAIVGGVDSDDNHRMAERLVRTVPHGRLVRVEDTAHYPSMERPDVFNAYVREFLTAL
ncbi:alpha/beta hydrolase [Streptomyces sp. NBC_00237]|uniref:alpha/beta fold hydrolase n=1 Tax=Streptomyces sp. NBC_00237 TaxID=2975687 RepID=UPI0022501B60|nr:alpha/beta hydrolase [Streptomyces sp. NBC_00237]MCX5204133.1 alpha/beta hydrolase [Streptomyces sp. NBC_00237]